MMMDFDIEPEEKRIYEKEELTPFEVRKLQRMAEYLYKENEELSKKIREMNINQFAYFNNEECWIWQGDDSDHLESLVCPVVISPDTLMKLIGQSRKPKGNVLISC